VTLQAHVLQAEVDPESLERENNKDVDALGDRVHMLRQVALLTRVPCCCSMLNACALNSAHLGITSAPLACDADWRVHLSPQLTTNIHSEVNSHNRVLDNLVRPR